MVSIPKVVGVLSCGFLLCFGLSTATQADEMKGGQDSRKGEQAGRKGDQDKLKKDDMKAGQSTKKGGQASVKGEEDKSKGVDMIKGMRKVTKWAIRRRAAPEKAPGRSRAMSRVEDGNNYNQGYALTRCCKDQYGSHEIPGGSIPPFCREERI